MCLGKRAAHMNLRIATKCLVGAGEDAVSPGEGRASSAPYRSRGCGTRGPDRSVGRVLGRRIGGRGRGAAGGIALRITECDGRSPVCRVCPVEKIELGANERGGRSLVLTYLHGSWPGVYRFVGGRSRPSRCPTGIHISDRLGASSIARLEWAFKWQISVPSLHAVARKVIGDVRIYCRRRRHIGIGAGGIAFLSLRKAASIERACEPRFML
jgi:hypothetical protein